MKNVTSVKSVIAAVLSAMLLTACSSGTDETADPTATYPAVSIDASTPVEESGAPDYLTPPATVEITDIHGSVTVPVNPERVVSFDNRTYYTLADWGVKLVAGPKDVMPAGLSYKEDDSVANIGNHREPNLEVLAAADPDLVIIGQRFAGYYDEIKELVPNAVVIDLNIDVSETAVNPGENLVNGLKEATTTLGMIFNKNEEASRFCADFDNSIAEVKAAYNGEDTVMTVIVSGGNIGYAAPGTGRVWGPMYEIFGWVSSLEAIDSTTSDHEGDEISVEAIAQSNPDWIFVLDRDAGANSEESVPARDIINNSPALKNTTAIIEGNIVYAPNDTYTNESIQTYLKLFSDLSAALS